MPRGLDPTQTYTVFLESDAEKSPRPEFVYRHLNCREWRKAAQLYDMDAGAKADKNLDAVFEMLRMGLVGWRNMTDPATGDEIAFNPADLDLLIDMNEAMELTEKVLGNGQVSPDDTKKSALSA